MLRRFQVKAEVRDAAAAQAMALQDGFTLGEWLVEPRDLRVSRGDVTITVTAPHMQVLVCLVESRGGFVDRRILRSRVYPHQPSGDRQLREAILAWHAVFGDSSRRPRYVAANGRDGYSIIARLEPRIRRPIPERLMAAGLRRSGAPGPRWSIVGFAHRLLAELRRRRVFQVSASYLIGMWLLLQVAEVTFAPLHFPAWWVTALTILAVIGWPIMIALAWTYEITSDGVVRDSVDLAATAHLPGSRRVIAPTIVAGIVLMAAVTGYAWWESIR
jgi:DNA-binding winged helix-turn-helix (wHTH) protein